MTMIDNVNDNGTEHNFATEIEIEDVDLAPQFSEEEMALLLATRHAGRLRYVAKWGRWYIYDGQRWSYDEKRMVFTLARRICRETAELAAQTPSNRSNSAKGIASAKTRAALVSLASDDQRLAATFDQWDADPWLLNTPGGVVDLRTGNLRPHRPVDYMTKITAVTPDKNCPIPLFTAFLNRATADDQAVQGYLKRIAGYSLTGITREHAMFFLHGEGRNGKSVLLNTEAEILGDYHTTAPMETFIASKGERHPTDMAGLQGARMVTATETERGRSWNETMIKRITGADEVSARFMRQDFFEYFPQFKLTIAGNSKPRLKCVDVAIKARMKLIPFTVVIPEAERDRDLPEKLKTEWPGILAWMVQGCLDWQRQGLDPPPAVVAATDEYFESEDVFQAWIDECCITGADKWAGTVALFERWKNWAEVTNENIGTRKDFTAMLEISFAKRRTASGIGFSGIELNPRWQAPI